MSWRANAACRGVPVAVFYRDNTAQAEALCDTCPVKAECLAAAADEEMGIEWRTHGYRAGMTPAERIRHARTGAMPAPRRPVAAYFLSVADCSVCGGPLPPSGPKGGRPAVYCGTTCRSTAQRRRRRAA